MPTVAVVTGGHSYDVPSFHRLFRSLGDDIDAYIQHMDDFASSPEEVREAYDVVLFYTMLQEGPVDEGLPWHAGRPLTALSHLGETAQGIVVLHHALLAYPNWSKWRDLVGFDNRSFGYDIGETVRSHLEDPTHPVLAGLSDWEMVDETYKMPEVGADSHLLITYDHPKSVRTIAWTRMHGASRVFCYQAGHDDRTWVDPSFRQVLANGVRWAASSSGAHC